MKVNSDQIQGQYRLGIQDRNLPFFDAKVKLRRNVCTQNCVITKKT